MRKTLLVAALISFVTPALLAAQSTITPGIHMLDFSFSPFGDRINEVNCIIPNLPSSALDPAQVVSFKAGDKLYWCVDTTYNDQGSYKYMLAVDTEPAVQLIAYCSNINPPIICVGSIPLPFITILQQPKNHTLVLSYMDSISGNVGVSSIINVRRSICVDSGKTYEIGASLPATSVGALRNQVGMFTLEQRIAELRSTGWLVEWQRTQFGKDTDGLNGYNYLLAWCNGK